MTGRYEASGPEGEFQPGSRGRVLRNQLGITSVRELERNESEALLAATQQIIDETMVDQRFTADDLRRMHRRWLGDIYEWAGEYRGVNIAKGEFMFAAATQVPRLMQEFDCRAGLPALDFGGIRGVKKRSYIAAIHAALNRDYAPMNQVFRGVIAQTLRSATRTSSE